MFIVLHHTVKRNITKSGFFKHGFNGIYLTDTTVKQYQVGQCLKALILLIFVNRKSSANPYILVLQCDGHESETAAKEYLDGVTQRCTVKSKTARAGAVELNYEIRLKDDNTDFINILSGMQGVRSAALVSYNGDYMG